MSCRLLDKFICFEQKFGQDDLLRFLPIRVILRSGEHSAFPDLLSHAFKKALEIMYSGIHSVAILGVCVASSCIYST